MLGIGQIDLDRLPEIRRRIDTLIRRILEEIPARKVILHGSFATGGVHQGSDVDLIVVAAFKERFIDRVDRVQALNADRLPIEVFCYTPDEFERAIAERNPFILAALAKGRVHDAGDELPS